jgi:ATP-dependent DNA helicase RecG
MSATPIPRSLAMTIYGDFVDVYTIKKMPKGRKKVITSIQPKASKAYDFMYEQIKEGRQCYVVCPLIEETESERMEGVKSTEETYVEMCDYFSSDPSIRICHINGKMKQDEINEYLSAFARHEYDIIISTTIIEVGVNVPNSTVILVKNAERFGLATLHQLRGRVGRGSYQSYCLLQSPKGQTERLSIMESTTDGFIIAEKDLELRGMGDFIGTKQSGENKAVMLMLGNPSLYNNIKNFTMEIVKDPIRMKKYQFILDDFNSLMGEEEDF